jgi:DNA-directed RNA polymerase specialized sigma24 family protein
LDDPLGEALTALGPALHSFFDRRAAGGAADDLLQETSFRVERLRAEYDAGRPPQPWIWRIARLVLLEHLRAPRHERLEAAEAVAAPEAELERVRRDHEERVWTAVRELEDGPRSRLRAFVALHALEGVPHARLATEFGIGESASKMRVKRGLEALEAILAQGRAAWTPARADAATAAWRFVRDCGERGERTAILAIFGRIPGNLRAAMGLANAPIDELGAARADERLRATGWPYP